MEQPLTKAIDLLYLAKQNGIDIILNKEQLQLKLPKNKVIDKGLLDEIKNNKQIIVDFLKQHEKAENKVSEITRYDRNSAPRLPLSFSQERLWFIDQMDGSKQYHIPAVLRLKGNLNTQALNKAFQHIVDRHEVLRTVFLQEEEQAYQSIRDMESWQLAMIDGSGYKQDDKALQHYIQELIREPFDLSKDYMVRASLISVGEQDHVLVVTMHHIASDGWSISIIVKEVVELYAAYVEGRSPRLVPLPIQYADYAIWQRTHLQGEMLGRKVGYWKQKLEGVAALQLPTDHQRPAVWTARGATKGFSLDKALSTQLQAFSQQQGTTLYMTLLAAFKVLLHKYSGQQDICVGSPIANRTRQEVEGLIGFFVNTLALRTEVSGDASFTELLQQVRVTTMEAYEHQDVPFEKVVEVVVKERNLSRNPLFQVMFALQNTPEVSQPHLGEVKLSAVVHENSTALFDLTFLITESATGLQGIMEYATDLYNEATIIRMMEHFKTLLGSIVKAPQQKVDDLVMLSKAEEHQLLIDFNDTTIDYPKNKNIAGLFEEQAAKTPDATAVVFEKVALSYKMLNEKANQLAHYLRKRGVQEELLVPICIERSIEMIIGILGILKAGATYVPIDPEYPKERIIYMLQDTDAAVVVSSRESRSKLQVFAGVEVIELDTDWPVISNETTTNLQIDLQPHLLAYLIYTSGSTGKPKGVRMGGSGMVNLLTWQEKQFENRNRHVLQFASLNFDVSFQEIFSTLCFGSTLYLISEDNRKDTHKMIDDLRKNHITHLFIPYIVLKTLVEYISSLPEVSFSLEEIIVAGEQLKFTEDIQSFVNKNNVALINHYGPSETHVVSHFRVDTNSVSTPLPPIGKPIDNTSLYILNDAGKLLPIGVAGELYIGGVQVARGYLNREELTTEKFITDPFSKEPGARMYRTGDLSRWLTDGNIEYLGRIDDQVKIRGYRIEIGEIESVLQQHEGVRQAVVMAREGSGGNKRLVGYVVAEGDFKKQEIVLYLKERLPEYMVPVLWVELESLPVTANGKVNRKVLPDPDTSEGLSDNYVGPRDEVEEKLVEIWKKLLDVEKVSTQDNFFEAGGHSLLAMRLISAIRRELAVEVPLLEIFGCTIQSLAEKIKQQQERTTDPAPGEPQNTADTPLTFSQVFEQTRRLETGIIEWSNGDGKYLIPIKADGTRIPFFGIISYKSYSLLGNFMPNDQPLYYLPPTQSASVEEIASHYVREMKHLQPTGPYCLGGFCAAGMIALEIAQQLTAQGDEVSALVLLEFYAPHTMISRKSVSYRKRRFSYYKNRLITLSKSRQSRVDLTRYLIKKTVDKFKKRFGKRPPSRFMTSPEYYKYRYKPYAGKVILFQASIQPLEMNQSPLMGWSAYFTGAVELIKIDGGHLGILREPAVAKLAEKLNTVLEEVNTGLKQNAKI